MKFNHGSQSNTEHKRGERAGHPRSDETAREAPRAESPRNHGNGGGGVNRGREESDEGRISITDDCNSWIEK